jgi:hypothetical protein
MLVTGVGVLEQGWAVRLRKVPGLGKTRKNKLNEIAHMTDTPDEHENFEYNEKFAEFIAECMIEKSLRTPLSKNAYERAIYYNHFVNDPLFAHYLETHLNNGSKKVEGDNVVKHNYPENVEEDNSSGDDQFVADNWTQRTLHAEEWKPPPARPQTAPLRPSPARPSIPACNTTFKA